MPLRNIKKKKRLCSALEILERRWVEMGFPSKLIQINLTGISPKRHVFTISGTKISFQKREGVGGKGREEKRRKRRKKAVPRQSQRPWRTF